MPMQVTLVSSPWVLSLRCSKTRRQGRVALPFTERKNSVGCTALAKSRAPGPDATFRPSSTYHFLAT